MLRRLYLTAKLGIDILAQKVINQSYALLEYSVRIRSKFLHALIASIAAITGNVATLMLELPRLDAVLVTGAVGSVVYVGEDDSFKISLLEALFPDGYEESSKGRSALWKLPNLTHNWLNDNDLVISRVSQFFPWHIPAAYAFDSHISVEQVLFLDKSIEDLLAGGNKRNLRKEINRMLKLHYTRRISNSVQDLEYFYHRMYVPTAQQRHHERAIIRPYEYFEDLLKDGFLIFLSLDGQEIGGNICYVMNDIFYSKFIGFLDGNTELLKREVNTALYWHAIQYAYELKVSKISFTSSNAWVSDGVFNYKHRWDAKVYTDFGQHEQMLFRAQNLSTEWHERLNNIGFISYEKGMHLRVFIDQATGPLENACHHAIEEGLDGIQVIIPGQHHNYLESGA